MNTPALDRFLMYDTREPNLQQQAFNAIHGHAQNTREPTALELDLIKEFQQTDSRFFSSEALRDFANGGLRPNSRPVQPNPKNAVVRCSTMFRSMA